MTLARRKKNNGRWPSSSNGAEERSRNGKASSKELKAPWLAYLAKHHLKLSKIREEIVEVFLHTKGHVGLEQLHEQVKKHNPKIGFASVYRALKLLEQAGIAESRHFNDRAVSYELTAGKAHHDHLICEGCGTIVEFADAEIERIQEATARAHGFVLLRHRHDLLGLCGACRPGQQ
jgi:Fur family transcriptional regulator, ferric uptake regulator